MSLPTPRPPMTSEEAREKVVECIELAKAACQTSHQIMYNHMAETWERIARDIEKYKLQR